MHPHYTVDGKKTRLNTLIMSSKLFNKLDKTPAIKLKRIWEV